MVDVFISYARTNQELVRQLAEAVKREGYDVWWDDALPPHLSYGDVITEKIGAAKAAIVVWSHDAAASEWVRAEADVARNQKKLIQTSIDDRMPPMPFNQIQFAFIGDWRGEDDHPGWTKVKASLGALCGEAPATDRAYPMPATPSPGAAPPPAAAAAAPHKWHGLLIGVIALAFLVIAGFGLFAWMGGGAPTTPDQSPPQVAKPAGPDGNREATPEQAAQPKPPPLTTRGTAESQPRAPTWQRAHGDLGGGRRHCRGRGRNRPDCQQRPSGRAKPDR